MNKLAACYTVFNGEELLQQSMKQIDSEVDLFIVCFQIISNKGHENRHLKPFLGCFVGNKKVIMVNFNPDLSLNTKENERRKHQLMIETARNNGATHVLLAACDHFYDAQQFKYAKERSFNHDLDISFTSMFTYYKSPEWQLTPKEDYFMPFIIKLHPTTKICYNKDFPLKTDPSVQVNTFMVWGLFTEDECILHHYSMIRKDIYNKLHNAAASIRWKNEELILHGIEYETYDINKNPGVSYFQGRKIKLVPNYFDL